MDKDTPKIIDFGYAKVVNDKEGVASPISQNQFVAPEVFKGTFTAQSDMWTLGILVHLMICGKLPFASDKEVMEYQMRQGYIDFEDHVSDLGRNFVSLLLEKNADVRFTPAEAFEHPWLKLAPSRSKLTKKELQNLRYFTATTDAKK